MAGEEELLHAGSDRLVQLLVWTTLAGACIPIGGLLARVERIRPRWLEEELRHFVIAFGGGILVGAVALVLVPEGVERLPHPAAAAMVLAAGGVAFMAFERYQGRGRRPTPQISAMAADFIPESIALGGMFAADEEGTLLLAVLIGLQNLPEGFNAWREVAGRSRGGRALGWMALIGLLGPACGLIGWFWLAGHDAVLGAVMLVAAGGILYLTFQDIAPQSRLKRHWAPPVGAVCGFALALVGEMLL